VSLRLQTCVVIGGKDDVEIESLFFADYHSRGPPKFSGPEFIDDVRGCHGARPETSSEGERNAETLNTVKWTTLHSDRGGDRRFGRTKWMSTRGNLYHGSNPNFRNDPPLETLPEKNTDACKSRVDDKIKWWMPMRYADIPFPQPRKNTPALPIILAGLKSTHVRSEIQGSLRIERENQREEPRIGCWMNWISIWMFVSTGAFLSTASLEYYS